ncbi:unnamed protein product [Ixodes pacificus]
MHLKDMKHWGTPNKVGSAPQHNASECNICSASCTSFMPLITLLCKRSQKPGGSHRAHTGGGASTAFLICHQPRLNLDLTKSPGTRKLITVKSTIVPLARSRWTTPHSTLCQESRRAL